MRVGDACTQNGIPIRPHDTRLAQPLLGPLRELERAIGIVGILCDPGGSLVAGHFRKIVLAGELESRVERGFRLVGPTERCRNARALTQQLALQR